MPNVYWDSNENDVVINDEWLREQVTSFASEALGDNQRFTRDDYDAVKEAMRLHLLEEPRMRACLVKSNGKPSAPAQFKRLESTCVTYFKRAIRRKAGRSGSGTGSKVGRSLDAIDRLGKDGPE